MPQSPLLVLTTPLPMHLTDVHGKALAPLVCRGVAEPIALLIRVRVVCAQATDESQLLLAVPAPAPLLIVALHIAALLEAECHTHCWRCSGGHFICILTCHGRSRHPNTLLILNELICKHSNKNSRQLVFLYRLIEKEGQRRPSQRCQS